jgi:hypothetical protein
MPEEVHESSLIDDLLVEDCRKDPGLWVELRYSIRKYFIEVLTM